jgi:hypothetical protein
MRSRRDMPASSLQLSVNRVTRNKDTEPRDRLVIHFDVGQQTTPRTVANIELPDVTNLIFRHRCRARITETIVPRRTMSQDRDQVVTPILYTPSSPYPS